MAYLCQLFLLGDPLKAAVPAVVVVAAVPVVLPVGLVVLAVKGYHVHHGKSVSMGHVVDRAEALGIVADAEYKGAHLVLVAF